MMRHAGFLSAFQILPERFWSFPTLQIEKSFEFVSLEAWIIINQTWTAATNFAQNLFVPPRYSWCGEVTISSTSGNNFGMSLNVYWTLYPLTSNRAFNSSAPHDYSLPWLGDRNKRGYLELCYELTLNIQCRCLGQQRKCVRGWSIIALHQPDRRPMLGNLNRS